MEKRLPILYKRRGGKNMKPLTGFVKKCCIIAENAKYPALELYLTYVNWCLNAGAPVQPASAQDACSGVSAAEAS